MRLGQGVQEAGLAWGLSVTSYLISLQKKKDYEIELLRFLEVSHTGAALATAAGDPKPREGLRWLKQGLHCCCPHLLPPRKCQDPAYMVCRDVCV